jgi:hypothetical protein
MKRLVFSILILLISTQLIAQPRKGKERINTVKKIKLLEVLELDENTADKVLVRYTSWENKIDNLIKEFDQQEENLTIAIKSGKKDEIVKNTNNFESIKSKFSKTVQDRDYDMKTILNDVQYAKYLVFEKNFRKELGQQIMKHRNGEGRDGSRGGRKGDGKGEGYRQK